MKLRSSSGILLATLLTALATVSSGTDVSYIQSSRQLSSGFSSFWEWLAWFLRGRTEQTTDSPTVSPTLSPVTFVYHPIRINCGGTDYTDSEGIEWTDDAHYSEGGIVGKSFLAYFFRIRDAQVFQSYRATTSNPLVYSIPVPAGSYRVNLFFSNPLSFYLPRSFTVYVQDRPSFSSDEIGAPGHQGPTWGTKLSTEVVVDDDGTIKIALNVLNRLASIAAIEILADDASVDPPVAAPFSKAPVSAVPTMGTARPVSSSPTKARVTSAPTAASPPTAEPTVNLPFTVSPTDAIATAVPTEPLATSPPTDVPTVPTEAPTEPLVTSSPILVTAVPTVEPTEPLMTNAPATPTAAPVKSPISASPITNPTVQPSRPIVFSSDKPTTSPITIPTMLPTAEPTMGQTSLPTMQPTTEPTMSPTFLTTVPTNEPTMAPTVLPTELPTGEPTMAPTTALPTTLAPTRTPVTFPTTELPTVSPTMSPTESPTTLMPSIAPVTSPTGAPVVAASNAPSEKPSTKPSNGPTALPTSDAPTKAPVPVASAFPSPSPTGAPSAAATLFPTPNPSVAPTNGPSKAPTTDVPTMSPTASPTQAPEPFEAIRINAGGSADYVDVLGRTWVADSMFTGGRKDASLGNEIFDTQDDILYQTSRFGVFQYDVPLPDGDYEVVLHFTELVAGTPGERVFVAKAEGDDMFGSIDIFAFGGFTLNRAVTMEKAVSVNDGSLTLSLEEGSPKRGDPKLCGVEIKSLGPHLAHSVAGGPYTVVDTNGSGNAIVEVDGGGSHTHGPGLTIVEYVWKSGFNLLGEGETTSVQLPVGVSPLTLTVRDSGGNVHTETTIVTVLPSEFPDISALSESSGPVEGGTPLTISGSGFSFSSAETTVKFGLATLTGAQIQVIDKNTIRLTAPPSSVAVPVAVAVITPVGESSEVTFTYIASDAPIDFKSGLMVRIRFPTSVAFGPDGSLYVGTYTGQLNRIEFQDGNLKVKKWTQETVTPFRSILGIAFDPLDTAPISTPFIAHSYFFHKDATSSSGEAINGKISKVRGADLDDVEDVITGLPVSDHDHGLNGLQFGDNGELYITVGGNTNAGIPGAMTSTLQQKENVLSAAVLVAYVNRPDFDGKLTYDAPDDGNLVGGNGVELFSVGFRNPFGLIQHSNGHLYTNDNGPNLDFGDIMLGCRGERMADREDFDKLILLKRGNYYGHPNAKRAENDSRQCTWRPSTDPSGNGYTAPIMTLESATGGMIEFMTNHFGGQLRGNLIYSKYGGALHRVILSGDGRSVLPISNPALPLVGDFSLAVTQAPMGELIEARYEEGHIFFHRPIETSTAETQIKGVFPYRGSRSGGSILTVYGVNLNKNGLTPTILVGGSSCPVTDVKAFRVACTLPSGSGTVDVELTLGSESFTFPKAYRYIVGR